MKVLSIHQKNNDKHVDSYSWTIYRSWIFKHKTTISPSKIQRPGGSPGVMDSTDGQPCAGSNGQVADSHRRGVCPSLAME